MPYIISFLFSVIFAKFSENCRHKSKVFFCFFAVVSIMIPTLLAGLRDISVGTDVMSYIVPDYNIACGFTDILPFIENILGQRNREIGYAVIIYIASRMGSLNWALFFLQLITMVCVYTGIQKRKESISPVFTLSLYFLFFYMDSYNIMRQMTAVAIVFYGSLYIEEKRYFRFLPYVAIAVLFHWSALYSLIFLFIHIAAQKGWQFQWLFALGVAAWFIVINFFSQYMVKWMPWFHYINGFSQRANSDQTIETITYLLVMLLAIISRMVNKNEDNYAYNLMISYILVIMAFSSGIVPNIKRMTYYFALINLPIICKIPHMFANNSKIIIYAGILLYAAMFWIYMFAIQGSGGMMPYRSIVR